MNVKGSSACESSGEATDGGEQQPGGSTGGGRLEVLGQASAAAEPGQGAFDDPSSGQEEVAFDARRTLDDLDGRRAAIVDGGPQLGTAVDAIGEDMVQLGEGATQGAQQRHSAMRVLDVGLMDLADKQEALCIGDDVALAALDALAGIDPTRAAAVRGRH